MQSWRQPAAKDSAYSRNLMSRVSCLGSKKAPAFHCVHRAIHSNSGAVRCFAGRAKNGYLWAAFLARRSVRSLAPSFPLLSLARKMIKSPNGTAQHSDGRKSIVKSMPKFSNCLIDKFSNYLNGNHSSPIHVIPTVAAIPYLCIAEPFNP